MSLELERAVTQFVDARGRTSPARRPRRVVEVMARVQRWASTAETCRSCVARPAVSIRKMEALCVSCLAHREQREALSAPFNAPLTWEQRREPMKGKRLEGYAIRVNSLSVDLGGFRERIMPEALQRTLKERIDVAALWNHNSDIPLGKMSAGTLRIYQDANGLANEIALSTEAAREYSAVKRRDVTGQSFGFYVIEDDWHLEDDKPVRHVFDMRVHETSATMFPAYPETSVEAMESDDRHQRWLETQERIRLSQ